MHASSVAVGAWPRLQLPPVSQLPLLAVVHELVHVSRLSTLAAICWTFATTGATASLQPTRMEMAARVATRRTLELRMLRFLAWVAQVDATFRLRTDHPL